MSYLGNSLSESYFSAENQSVYSKAPADWNSCLKPHKYCSNLLNFLLQCGKPYMLILSYHHHVTLLARISLSVFRHSSLSSFAPGRSFRLHPVSAQSWCRYVLAGRPTPTRPCEGVHRSTSLMCSSLLLQQCPACLVRLNWNGFHDEWSVGVQLLFCRVLPPGLVQYSSQRSCVIAVKLFLRMLS